MTISFAPGSYAPRLWRQRSPSRERSAGQGQAERSLGCADWFPEAWPNVDSLV